MLCLLDEPPLNGAALADSVPVSRTGLWQPLDGLSRERGWRAFALLTLSRPMLSYSGPVARR